MKLVDVHAHLDFPEFDKDRDSVIKACESAGVKAIICNGTKPESNRKVLKLEKKYAIVKAALGFYPTELLTVSETDFQEELVFIKKQKPTAIGEVGLDKKWTDYNPESKYKLQKERFEQIIQLAEKIKRPLIIHSRKAEEDMINLLESSKIKTANFHCFCGKKSLLKRIIDNNWNVSIPANVFKNQQFQQHIELLPLSLILTETDSPYLSGTAERNTPANVKIAIEYVAKIKKITEEEAANQVFMNYQKFIA